MMFTAFYLFLGIFSNWFRFSLITAKLVRVKNVIRRNSFHPSTYNSDDEEENISDLEIGLDEDELVKDRSMIGEGLESTMSGDFDISPSTASVGQEKGACINVVKEMDENGQLVIANAPELAHEADMISISGSSGEVMGESPLLLVAIIAHSFVLISNFQQT